uniref:DUF5899 domain-containing protein n=1 Tax=viral metagenome TaxID=1070528 RepID=A0A6C0E6A0_9ZZZZ
MELAIPLVALGGMYVISTQKNNSNDQQKKKVRFSEKKQQPENFTNMGRQPNYLPNTNIPPQNYPITNDRELVDTIQHYPNPNTATDKYFNQNVYEEKDRAGVKTGNNIQEIYSLSGNYLNSEQFRHNNMVPFYGGKIKGKLYDDNIAESVLDNMAGTGSQVIKKIEQAPLFKPQENVQWAYGMPDMSDFYQSRVNPGMKNNNVKPFESIRVGPGLDKGYSSEGTGGFNSGMEAREVWLPKTVDELRIMTNPKEEFSLLNHEGPAQSVIKNVGKIGVVEKYTPDTFYIQTQDRWLTTTGLEKQTRMIAEEIQKQSHRNDTTTYYSGAPNSTLKTASYVPKVYEEPKRPVLPIKDVAPSTATGRGPITDGESFLKSHTNIVNNRATTKQNDTFGSGFSRAIGAAIAPIMDIMKPSRKEEYSCNMRIYGNIGGEVPQNYVINPGDVPNTTIRETTLYTPHGNIGNQIDGAYTVTEQQSIQNQRDTTNHSNLGGAGGSGAKYGNRQYDANYRQTNNMTKEQTVVARTNQGNAQLFNPVMNATISKLDSDRDNNRMWAPEAVIPAGPSVQTYGKINMPQYYNECYNCDRIQPDLLNAFRENPYTHSLTYSV